jgi:flavodoxin
MSNTLIVFYSRTGTAKKIAENIAQKLNAELEEIKTKKDRKGPLGYILSGKEAMQKTPAEIEPTTKNPTTYDLVIFGSPIWSWNLSSPMRAYLEKNKSDLKKVAFFCTMGGSGDDVAFAEMEKICGQKPLATLTLTTKEVLQNKIAVKIQEFIAKIK